MKRLILSVALVAAMILTGCSSSDTRGFVKVQDGEFVLDGKPFSFVGTNFWYGAIIASEGRGGNRERLHKELDALKEIGVTNLRILVGSDGPEGAAYKVEPVLQPEPGVYNDTLLRGLDYLLAEMAKREMHAVLYFNNSWEWSGGYGQYLQWTGHGRCPLPVEDGYNAYVEYVRQFVMDDAAKQLYYNHVKNIITRTNTVTGKPYTEDPTIFSWQIANEPRAFAQDSLTKANFVDWINRSAELIKSLDSNHMVSTGSEGVVGCAFDMSMLEEMHSSDAVDYVNIHIWPLVWRWVTKDTYADSIHVAMRKTEEYITSHYPVAERLGKPIVLEEFGYPRDGNTAFDGPVKNFWDGVSLSKDTPTTARDKYYGFVFEKLIQARKNGEPLSGVNFWGWGGHASQSPVNTFWRPGDDYCGDPAQEPQGLFSVYATDASTVELIKRTTEALTEEL